MLLKIPTRKSINMVVIESKIFVRHRHWNIIDRFKNKIYIYFIPLTCLSEDDNSPGRNDFGFKEKKIKIKRRVVNKQLN